MSRITNKQALIEALKQIDVGNQPFMHIPVIRDALLFLLDEPICGHCFYWNIAITQDHRILARPWHRCMNPDTTFGDVTGGVGHCGNQPQLYTDRDCTCPYYEQQTKG